MTKESEKMDMLSEVLEEVMYLEFELGITLLLDGVWLNGSHCFDASAVSKCRKAIQDRWSVADSVLERLGYYNVGKFMEKDQLDRYQIIIQAFYDQFSTCKLLLENETTWLVRFDVEESNQLLIREYRLTANAATLCDIRTMRKLFYNCKRTLLFNQNMGRTFRQGQGD